MLKKSFAILMACLLLPVAALAETDAERIADLEARVQALEEAVAALQGNAEAEPEERTEPVELEDAFPAAQGVEASAVSWDFLSRFSYYPSGSYFSRTLSASNGYVLVGVYMNVENGSDEDFMVSSLLDARMAYGDSYTTQPEETFFYRQSQNVYASGLRAIGARASASGCLLFALPEEAYRDEEPISLSFSVDGVAYTYTLRGSQMNLPLGSEEASC